jgi:hypothetical protein
MKLESIKGREFCSQLLASGEGLCCIELIYADIEHKHHNRKIKFYGPTSGLGTSKYGNFGTLLLDHMASRPRRQQSSAISLSAFHNIKTWYIQNNNLYTITILNNFAI